MIHAALSKPDGQASEQSASDWPKNKFQVLVSFL
jgi:hypothetical protein